MKKKSIVYASIALLAALCAVGAGAQARTTAKDTLVIANRADVGTLAPYVDTSMQGSRVRMQIYEPLFYLQEDGSFSPCLATSWNWDDPTHFTVKLRQGVKFHNGKSFDANDVLFTLGWAKKGQLAPRFAKLDIAQSKAVDPYTVQLAYSSPDGVAMSNLGGTLGLIMDKETVEADPDALPSTPVGTGPYKFVSWITGDSVTIERFDGYWGKDKAIIKTVIFRNVSEVTQRTIELQTAGVDFVYDLAATAVPTLQKESAKYAVFSQPSSLINSIYPNTMPGRVFNSADARKAAALAISAKDIIKGAYDGNGSPPATYVSRSSPGFDKSLASSSFWPQDLAKAREYFAKSGLAKGVNVNVMVDGNAFRIATCEIIKNQLAQVGFNCTIKQYDFGTAISLALDPSKDWDLFLLGSGEATAIGQTAWYNGATGFVTYPNIDPAFKAAAEKALATSDPVAQAKLVNQLQNEVVKNVAMIPVQEDRVLWAYNAKLKNVDPAAYLGMLVFCKDLYFIK